MRSSKSLKENKLEDKKGPAYETPGFWFWGRRGSLLGLMESKSFSVEVIFRRAEIATANHLLSLEKLPERDISMVATFRTGQYRDELIFRISESIAFVEGKDRSVIHNRNTFFQLLH